MFDLIYHCDAFPGIGMGHVTRALSVLEELRHRAPRLTLGLAGGFSESAVRFIEQNLADRVEFLADAWRQHPSLVGVYDSMAEPGDPTVLDVERLAHVKEQSSTVVMVSSALEVQVSAAVDVLIDHMPEVRILGPEPLRCRFGLEYAPVAREFFEIAGVPAMEATALVAVIGGNDRQDGPEILLDLLPADLEHQFQELEMIVSPHYPRTAVGELRSRNPKWNILQNVPSVAAHLARARAVVCTYGNATYESLALGKPTFVVGYRSFQEAYAQVLESHGLVVNCGLFSARQRGGLEKLVSTRALAQLHDRAGSAPVGCGVSAIVKILLEEITGASQP